MKVKNFHILDENTPVVVLIYLAGGGTMTCFSRAKNAREALREWKKYALFVTLPEEKKKAAPPEDIPYYLYHFLEGNADDPNSQHACCSFYMGQVVGMRYEEIEENENDSMVKMQKEFMEMTVKKLRSELKDDAWKDKE